MSPIQPLAIFGGVAAATSGAASKVAAGGNAFLKAARRRRINTGESALAISDAEKEQRLELKLQEFGDRLRERLKSAGINVSQPIELELSPTGGIQVVGGHPDLARIEAVLNETPTAGAELGALLQQGKGASLSLTAKDATLTPAPNEFTAAA